MHIKLPIWWKIRAKMHTFHQKSLSLHGKPENSWFYCDRYWRTHILNKQNFLLLRPSWMSSWISQSAINYTNLCWQMQILQTVRNIMVYDTSCKKKIFDSLKFWIHRVPLKMTLLEHKMTKILHILGYFPWKCLFFLRNHLKPLENLQKWLYHSWYWVGLI